MTEKDVSVRWIRIRIGITSPTYVASAADMSSALSRGDWPSKTGEAYRRAVRLASEAMAGNCSTASALDAFRAAAIEQNIVAA